jgi:hypothetical protein
MNHLIRQISFTISIISLIAVFLGVMGIYNEWGLSKSLNIFSSGITGLIISTSFAITAYSQKRILRTLQIILSAGLIWIMTRIDLNTIFYYSICFHLLWITTLMMLTNFSNKIQVIALLVTLITSLIAHLIKPQEIVYIFTLITLVMSSLTLLSGQANQSK